MKTKRGFTNGTHPYYGKYNSRSQRQRSKIIKGIKNLARPWVFELIQKELITNKYDYHNRKIAN